MYFTSPVVCLGIKSLIFQVFSPFCFLPPPSSSLLSLCGRSSHSRTSSLQGSKIQAQCTQTEKCHLKHCWAKRKDQQLNSVALCTLSICASQAELNSLPALSPQKGTGVPQDLWQIRQTHEDLSNSPEHLWAVGFVHMGMSEMILRWFSSLINTARCEPVFAMPMSQIQTTEHDRSPGEKLL